MQYRLVEVDQNLTREESVLIKMVFVRDNSAARTSPCVKEVTRKRFDEQLKVAKNSLVTYIRSNMASPQLRALIGHQLKYSDKTMVITLDSVSVAPVTIKQFTPNPQGRGLSILLGGVA